MAKTIKLTVNGITVECLTKDMNQVISALRGEKTGMDAPKAEYNSTKAIKRAIQSITGDTAEDFVINVLTKNLNNGHGLHTVFTGLNEAIKAKYGRDPVEVYNGLVALGLIKSRQAPKGYAISLP